ncbi:MAG: hypothetical protein ABF294_08040, partial [Flavobacteriales bacterium]
MNNSSFESRRIVLLVIVLSIGIIFAIRLFYVQILDDKWKDESIKISETNLVIEPERGIIFDRNGKLLAANKVNFELRLTPNNIRDFDTTQLCELIHIPKDSLKRKINKLKRYWRSKQVLIKTVPEKNLS